MTEDTLTLEQRRKKARREEEVATASIGDRQETVQRPSASDGVPVLIAPPQPAISANLSEHLTT